MLIRACCVSRSNVFPKQFLFSKWNSKRFPQTKMCSIKSDLEDAEYFVFQSLSSLRHFVCWFPPPVLPFNSSMLNSSCTHLILSQCWYLRSEFVPDLWKMGKCMGWKQHHISPACFKLQTDAEWIKWMKAWNQKKKKMKQKTPIMPKTAIE